MLFIRSLLSPSSRATQDAQVSSLIDKVGVTGPGELQQEFGESLLHNIRKSAAPDRFIRALLDKLTELDTPEEIAKMVTLIHGAVCEAEYEGEVMEQLANISLSRGGEGKGKV